MKKFLLMLPLLFLATSFKVRPNEVIWIGTIEVSYDSRTNEFILNYSGNYDKCFTKYVVDHVLFKCDSMIDEEALDNQFQWADEPIDSCQVVPEKTKKKPTFQI